jgi:hypothetical protein
MKLHSTKIPLPEFSIRTPASAKRLMTRPRTSAFGAAITRPLLIPAFVPSSSIRNTGGQLAQLALGCVHPSTTTLECVRGAARVGAMLCAVAIAKWICGPLPSSALAATIASRNEQ